jgi:oligopeptide transport system ATP-binding protein
MAGIMTAPGEPHLRVIGLSKSFTRPRSLIDWASGRPAARLIALRDVSFDVARGETLGIVGESGCGKSTLARCLVRLHEVDDGEIVFEGEDVLAHRGDARRRYNRSVQMVFQDPNGSLNPRMTVGECIGEALAVHAIAPRAEIPARVRALLDIVKLPADAANRRPHEFSGGQRQRIAIARALAVEPACLIADEPLSALDASVQAQIVNLFLELQGRLGLTLVFITHDLRLVRHVAHHVAVMYLGRIVEIGPAQELFAAPRHPYTQGLIASVPQLTPKRSSAREAVSGEVPSPLAPPPGCAFHPRCPKAAERCREALPALEERDGAWPVACHFASQPSTAAPESAPTIEPMSLGLPQ